VKWDSDTIAASIFPPSINLSGGGPSLSIGRRGAHVTFGRGSVTRTIGIPGTGVFWTHRDGSHNGIHSGLGPDGRPVRKHHVVLLVVVVVVLWAMLRH
jgi:hypothetical protein